MTKVKLPKEITEAIEELRKDGYTDTQIVYEIERGGGDGILDEYFFETGTPDELMRALVIGYEVDKSPEDNVRDFYESTSGSNGFHVRLGVTKTLDLLGIKIGGVNA